MKKFFLFMTLVHFFFTIGNAPVYSKIYIDVTSPGLRKLPVAVQALAGHPIGNDLAEIVKADLQYTGLFTFIDESAFVETPNQGFNPANWKPLGVEVVVKGTLVISDEIEVNISAYDVVEVKNILKKRYSAEKRLLRLVAHKISNDIYERITGQKGIFDKKIAFVGEKGRGKSIYIMDWDGQRPRRLISRGEILMPPRWSPEGKRIAYSSQRNRIWGVYYLDLERMKEQLIYKSKGTSLVGGFMPDGESILLSSSHKGSPDIFLLHIKTNLLSRLTYSNSIEVSPAISPDGETIAYVSNTTYTPQIYIMDTMGNNSKRVTFTGAYNTSPNWAKGGDMLAFSGIIDGKLQIFTIRPDGTGLMLLTESGNNEDPVFSPDGRFIAFSSDREGYKAVYIMRSNGEGQKRISPGQLRAFGPSWSPD